jgi:7-cyano-7-deazaguanine synthase in queuosine biosynthesis
VPKDQPIDPQVIPSTYVPARNTIFLSVAMGWAEVLGAADIFIGVNALDYSGYPDCRPEFIRAFEQLAPAGDTSRRGGDAADDPYAVNRSVEGGDHQTRALAGPRLRVDPQLL